ncbi:7-cyano-7-deazaguanine synthase [compost metagenome]
MTEVFVHPDVTELRQSRRQRICVHLYGAKPQPGQAAIGGPIPSVLSRVTTPLDPTAFDFLSISMAVTAADTFVNREIAADGWVRDIDLKVAVQDPARWQPVIPTLEKALRFLSGDSWRLSVLSGGVPPPASRPRVHYKIKLEEAEAACLFSGGLDSAIGVLNLLEQEHKLVLVSHAYPNDASRQREILRHLPNPIPRLPLHASPKGDLGTANDVQMRTRSFNFLAMGTLGAATIARRTGQRVPLFIPENGLIAMNPPLTSRRIGALSTRTTHPHYLGLMQQVLDGVGIPVFIENPFAFMTKGEMIRDCHQRGLLASFASKTVSCGKWKRTHEQCGKCVPCIIRRSSFHAANVRGLKDGTDYRDPAKDLSKVFDYDTDLDDLMATMIASRRLPDLDIASWIAKSGPLPDDLAVKEALVDVVKRGMGEVRAYLASERLI